MVRTRLRRARKTQFQEIQPSKIEDKTKVYAGAKPDILSYPYDLFLLTLTIASNILGMSYTLNIKIEFSGRKDEGLRRG